MTFHLERRESLDAGLRRIATEQIGFALDDLADTTMPIDRKVHSLRKRCKKLRGLLRLVRPGMGAAFDIEDQRFRDAAHRLAEARDSSVRAAVVDALDAGGDAGSGPVPAVSPDALHGVPELFSAALDAVAAWPLDVHGFADIAPGLARTYRKCADASLRVGDAPDDATYHRLRKWTKYHWYHVRLLERIHPKVLRRRRNRLRKLQLELGDAHDLVPLIDELGAASPPDEQLLAKAEARRRKLYRRADKRAHDLFSMPADRLVAEFSNWWADWK